MKKSLKEISSLSSEDKKALIAELLNQNQNDISFLQLSPSQIKSWTYFEQSPQGPDYNLLLDIRLNGKIDFAVLEQAIIKLTERHEGLRTRVVSSSVGPIQFVMPSPKEILKIFDLRFETATAEFLNQYLRQTAATPFAVDRGPLFEATLIKIKDDENLLVLKMFHLICDGISCSILIKDLSDIYKSLLQKTEIPRPLANNLSDYIKLHQLQSLTAESESQVKFWEQALLHSSLGIRFPQSTMPISLKRSGSDIVLVQVEGESLTRLKEFCQNRGLTTFMFMTSIFFLALYLWTRQKDLSVISMINTRSDFDDGASFVVGDFGNQVIFTSQIEPEGSLSNFLAKSKDNILGVYSNSFYPFEHVIDAVNAARRRESELPLSLDKLNVELIMVNQEIPLEVEFSPGLVGVPNLTPSGFADNAVLELSVRLFTRGGSLLLQIEYNKAFHSHSHVQTFAENIRKVSEYIQSHPENSISQMRDALLNASAKIAG